MWWFQPNWKIISQIIAFLQIKVLKKKQIFETTA